MKKFLIIILVLILGAGIYAAYDYFNTVKNKDPFSLVPEDAIYMLECKDPANNWHSFSKSEEWKFLKTNPIFSGINEKANMLDSLMDQNASLLKLIGSRNLIISAHKISSTGIDFLYVIDLQRAAKANPLLTRLETIFNLMGYHIKTSQYSGTPIIEVFFPLKRERIYIGLYSNQAIVSYSSSLIHKSIDQATKGYWNKNQAFNEIDEQTSAGICKLYINYPWFYRYLRSFMDADNLPLKGVCHDLSLSAMRFDLTNFGIDLNGYTQVNDSSNSYLRALLRSGSHATLVQKVLSDRTAFILNLGFSNADEFYSNLETAFRASPASYAEFDEAKKRIEGYFGINLRKNFFSWMDGEVAFVQNEPSGLGHLNEFVVAIRASNIANAQENLNFIEERIRKRSPVKFKHIDYHGFSIHYLHMNGLFSLMFGKMFEKLQKPYYTIIDDYVIFSNSAETLLGMIEDYRNQKTLANDIEFQNFQNSLDKSSTVFSYINMPKLFPLLHNFASTSTFQHLQQNKEYVNCFAQDGFTLKSDNGKFATQISIHFVQPNIAIQSKSNIPDSLKTDSEAVVIGNLSEVQQFAIEKLEGNIYREYFEPIDSSKIKSEVEMRNGVKEGRYKQFDSLGHLIIRGKYDKGKKTGIWRYFNEQGFKIRKEKYKDGILEKSVTIGE